MTTLHPSDVVQTVLTLSGQLAALLEQPLSTIDYARRILDEVLAVVSCDVAVLWLRGDAGRACHELRRDGRRFRSTAWPGVDVEAPTPPFALELAAETLIAAGPNTDGPRSELLHSDDDGDDAFRCAVVVPLGVAGERLGALAFGRAAPPEVRGRERELFEAIGQTLAVSLALHASRSALRERVKELQCLYDIMQIVTVPDRGLPDILQGIAEALPRAWQHPEVAEARIVFEGRAYATPGFDGAQEVQRADIARGGVLRGRVEVAYTAPRALQHEGPFLREERALIDTIAHDVGLIADRLEAHARRARLEEQLQHADRLATIGKLAAGVAHELNEPLANVLGFAQLARKVGALPPQAAADIDRVVEASLHARDVIRRLLLFARQSPPQAAAVDLTFLVEDVLGFFETRWARGGVRLIRALSVAPRPVVDADRGQLRQVLVNLLVNAAQAMPRGGDLTVRTRSTDDRVELVVEDTGLGMSDEVRSQIFLPFFTTKDVNEGTGLGLSVVHGIVTAHGGHIDVESAPGRGSRFTVSLPAGAAAAGPDEREDG